MEVPQNSDGAERDEATAGSDEYEIHVDITDDNLVWLHSGEWELYLSAEEARMLGDALRDAAEDASGATE